MPRKAFLVLISIVIGGSAGAATGYLVTPMLPWEIQKIINKKPVFTRDTIVPRDAVWKKRAKV